LNLVIVTKMQRGVTLPIPTSKRNNLESESLL
jgi:hypothetical protein